MPVFIRSRKAGKYELRVTHPSLARPFYWTLGEREGARVVGERIVAALDRGQRSDWLMNLGRDRRIALTDAALTSTAAALDDGRQRSRALHPRRKVAMDIADAILGYRQSCFVAQSAQLLLDTLTSEVGTVPLGRVNYKWCEHWIRLQKSRSAPGTIRKKKAVLSRVFDWAMQNHPIWLVMNPLRVLPRGYSPDSRGTPPTEKGDGMSGRELAELFAPAPRSE